MNMYEAAPGIGYQRAVLAHIPVPHIELPEESPMTNEAAPATRILHITDGEGEERTRSYYYFEACGFVSEPFRAADTDAAEAHVMATFRNPANRDFDGDDGGIVGLDDDPREPWWECKTTFISDTDRNPDSAARLDAAIGRLTGGPDAPIPGAP